MFQCEKCANEDDKWLFNGMISYGRCEVCGNVGECIDAKSYKKPKKFEKEIKNMNKKPTSREVYKKVKTQIETEFDIWQKTLTEATVKLLQEIEKIIDDGDYENILTEKDKDKLTDMIGRKYLPNGKVNWGSSSCGRIKNEK